MDKLEPYEEFLRQAQQGFLRNSPMELLDIAFPIYQKEYPREVLQKNCGSCVYRVLNWVANKYFTTKTKRIEMESILNAGTEKVTGRKSTNTTRKSAKA